MTSWSIGRIIKREKNKNSEKVISRISRGKWIISNINIKKLKEGDVDDEVNDTIGGDGEDY